MDRPLSIDPRTGSVSLGGGVRLEPFQSKAAIEPRVADLANGSLDHGNGYEWLSLRGLSFGGRPASLALCFHEGQLEQIGWTVMLPNAPVEGEWPTREAIDEEVAFVRAALAKDGLSVRGGAKTCPWGEVWSAFDAKGLIASNGLRYRRA